MQIKCIYIYFFLNQIEKNAISPFGDASIKKLSMLPSASVERFGVSRMQDFFTKGFITYESPYGV